MWDGRSDWRLRQSRRRAGSVPGSLWPWSSHSESQAVEEGRQPGDRVVAVCGQKLAEFSVDGGAGGAQEQLTDTEQFEHVLAAGEVGW
jgi:hypothetical protein